MYKILILEPEYFDDEARRILGKVGRVYAKRMSRNELEKRIGGADVIIVRIETHLDRELLMRAKRLKLIGSATTGLDHIDTDFARKAGIRILNLHGTHTIPTAEHTVALMLSLSRRIPWAHASMSSGRWDRYRFIGIELHGRTLGIVGLGRIGKAVARYANAFGMKVLYYDPYVGSSALARKVTLRKLLEESDVVSVHAMLTRSDRNIISARQMRFMKRGALLINTARGMIVNEHDLVKALAEGTIAGAALDVFSEEPLADRNNLVVAYARTHQNLIITPHIGASTREAAHNAGVEVAKAVADELGG